MELLKNKFRDLSIKWKLSLALILSGLFLIGTYVYTAKSIFESDKISYVFDSQSGRLESVAKEIEAKFQRILLGARTAIATYSLSRGKPSVEGEKLLDEERAIISVELWNETQSRLVFQYVKAQSNFSFPSISTFKESNPGFLKETFSTESIVIEILNPDHQLLTIKYEEGGDTFFIRVGFKIKELLPKGRTNETLCLALNHQPIEVIDDRGFEYALFTHLVQGERSLTPKTHIWTYKENRFLVSESPLSYSSLSLYALTPEKEALGALNTLFNRSIVFLFLSSFALIFISLGLARGLTMDLLKLTNTAEEIGQGNFESNLTIQSQDEMGVLARAFVKMSKEIKRLLIETKEKERMEQELQTARYVQEKLFPKERNIEINEIEVSGTFVTSSECSGDWWYYFIQNDDLYIVIADATGHGTPAALITATARSIFSRLEKETLSISEMLRIWDRAVLSCAQGSLTMTGMLLKINTQTGCGSYVNASHESPLIFRMESSEHPEKMFFESIDSDPSARVGDNINQIKEVEFQLGKNESMVLYTDGIFAIEREDRPTLNEKRLGTMMAKIAPQLKSAESITLAVLEKFNTLRGELPLPDDALIISIKRKSI